MSVIGVLSDTHMKEPDAGLKSIFETGPFQHVNIIIHSGDFTSIKVVEFLEGLNLFYGVQGNMDDDDIREKLPLKRIIKVDGLRIGVTHGWGSPHNLEKRVFEYFNDPTLSCIVYGHSHVAKSNFIGKTLMFNPGSYKGSFLSFKGSVGKLYIEGGVIRGEIIEV